MILAFSVVDVENANNWVWFKECFEDDFPSFDVWMSDADKVIHCRAFSFSMPQSINDFVLSQCARHLATNCQEKCKGTMNEDHKCIMHDS